MGGWAGAVQQRLQQQNNRHPRRLAEQLGSEQQQTYPLLPLVRRGLLGLCRTAPACVELQQRGVARLVQLARRGQTQTWGAEPLVQRLLLGRQRRTGVALRPLLR